MTTDNESNAGERKTAITITAEDMEDMMLESNSSHDEVENKLNKLGIRSPKRLSPQSNGGTK